MEKGFFTKETHLLQGVIGAELSRLLNVQGGLMNNVLGY